jgi:hypothetical protein
MKPSGLFKHHPRQKAVLPPLDHMNIATDAILQLNGPRQSQWLHQSCNLSGDDRPQMLRYLLGGHIPSSSRASLLFRPFPATSHWPNAHFCVPVEPSDFLAEQFCQDQREIAGSGLLVACITRLPTARRLADTEPTSQVIMSDVSLRGWYRLSK